MVIFASLRTEGGARAHDSYDKDRVRLRLIALGLVPKNQPWHVLSAPHVQSVVAPRLEELPGWKVVGMWWASL